MSDIRVRVGQQNAIKVISSLSGFNGNISLSSLTDVDVSSVGDKYLLAYNSSTNKYEFVNPDEILISAVTEPTQVGLPTAFVDALGADLDNQIDVDGGNF
jgi:hypothetical protein